MELQWHLLRKEIVLGSANKTYAEQTALLGKDEEVSCALKMVYMMPLYCLATGTKLFTKYWARCRDLASDGRRVLVVFCDGGLRIDVWWSDGRIDCLGLSSPLEVPMLNLSPDFAHAKPGLFNFKKFYFV